MAKTAPPFVRYLLLAFILFLLFPPAYFNQPWAGLDPSYFIATNLAFKYHLVFGKDIVFPFGPLAILNDRFPIAVNRWIFLLFDIYFLSSLFILLKAVIQRRSRYGPLVFLFLGVVLALKEPLFQWFFLLFAFYLFYSIKEPTRLYPVSQAALLSLLCLFYKVNLGITAIMLFILVLHYLIILRKISLLRYALILCSYAAVLAILTWLLQVEIKGYIAGSLQLIDAYNDAMFTPAGHYTPFLIGALIIFFLIFSRLVYLLATNPRDTDDLVIYGVSATLIFVLYKSGFVRMDNYHMSHFFHIAGLMVGGLYVFSPPGPGPGRKWIAIQCWIALGICIILANTIPGIEHPYFSSNTLRYLYPQKFRNYYQGIINYTAFSSAAPDTANDLKRIIGDHSADIMPTEISALWFAGLRYDPRPVIQSYSAYNTYLDSLNCAKYLSPDAPDFVLFDLSSIDNRYAFFDEERTKMALFSHYEVAGEAGGQLLLQKKPLTPLRREASDNLTTQLGKDIPIEGGRDLQFSRVFVHYSFLGKIKRIFYQPPALTITFLLETGDSVTYPAIPTMLEDGVILNKYIKTRQDFRQLMETGHAGAAIRRFRIDEDPDNRGFEPGIRIESSYYSFQDKPAPVPK